MEGRDHFKNAAAGARGCGAIAGAATGAPGRRALRGSICRVLRRSFRLAVELAAWRA